MNAMFPLALRPMFNGTATEAMEVAKRIIGNKIQVDPRACRQLF